MLKLQIIRLWIVILDYFSSLLILGIKVSDFENFWGNWIKVAVQVFDSLIDRSTNQTWDRSPTLVQWKQ